MSALVVTGGLLAAVAIYAAQKWRAPEPAIVSAPPPEAVVEPEHPDGEQAPKQPDVVSERAALDAQPNQ